MKTGTTTRTRRRARIAAGCAIGQVVFGVLAVPQATSHSPASAVVSGLEDRAQQLRGLRFLSPVLVQVRAGDGFTDPAAHYVRASRMPAEQALKRALGLLEPRQELVQVRINQIAPGWAAYYDPAARVVAVRAIKRSPPVAATLVHEFVHALQHQHFAFDEADTPTRDAELALQALLEGDAERVEAAYLSTRRWPAKHLFPAARGLATVLRTPGTDGVPKLENQEFAFPYAVGPSFVEALIRAGGQRRLDAAFADPPTSTEQILHPEHYLEGEGPLAVAVPAADGGVTGTGVLGELRLLLMLSSVLPREEAERAAAGWGGDRYVTWAHAAQSCTRIRFVMDTAQDDRELLGALNRVAAARAGMSLTWDGTTVLTACR